MAALGCCCSRHAVLPSGHHHFSYLPRRRPASLQGPARAFGGQWEEKKKKKRERGNSNPNDYKIYTITALFEASRSGFLPSLPAFWPFLFFFYVYVCVIWFGLVWFLNHSAACALGFEIRVESSRVESSRVDFLAFHSARLQANAHKTLPQARKPAPARVADIHTNTHSTLRCASWPLGRAEAEPSWLSCAAVAAAAAAAGHRIAMQCHYHWQWKKRSSSSSSRRSRLWLQETAWPF